MDGSEGDMGGTIACVKREEYSIRQWPLAESASKNLWSPIDEDEKTSAEEATEGDCVGRNLLERNDGIVRKEGEWLRREEVELYGDRRFLCDI